MDRLCNKTNYLLLTIIFILLFVSTFAYLQQNAYATEKIEIPPDQNSYHYTVQLNNDGYLEDDVKFILKDRICGAYGSATLLAIEREVINFENYINRLTILPDGKNNKKWKIVIMTEHGPIDVHNMVKKAQDIQQSSSKLAYELEDIIKSAEAGYSDILFASDSNNRKYPIIKYYTCYTLSDINALKEKWRNAAISFLKAVALKNNEIKAIISEKQQ